MYTDISELKVGDRVKLVDPIKRSKTMVIEVKPDQWAKVLADDDKERQLSFAEPFFLGLAVAGLAAWAAWGLSLPPIDLHPSRPQQSASMPARQSASAPSRVSAESLSRDGIVITFGNLSRSGGAVEDMPFAVTTSKPIHYLMVECGFYDGSSLIQTSSHAVMNVEPGMTAHASILAFVEVARINAVNCRIASLEIEGK